jgi:hypothetical protein
MVTADEHVAVHLAFAEERALMRATTLIGAQTRLGFHDHDVHTIRGERERSIADEMIAPTETLPGRRRNRVRERRKGTR